MGAERFSPSVRALEILKLLNRRIREPYVRWCERSADEVIICLLLDFCVQIPEKVEQIIFSGENASENNMNILYANERGVFDLKNGEMRLIEIV